MTFLEAFFSVFGAAAFFTAGLGCDGAACGFGGGMAAVVCGAGSGGVCAALPKIGKPSSGCGEGVWAHAVSTDASAPRANNRRISVTRPE
ncbi:MAG TPA: hypothetical protein VG900_16905 [Hyphomicrobiaceae bacterium]|nr:hypothetical protein [Hyphomicrobiaceae bacterium]